MRRIAVLTGGTGQPSSSRLLADRLATAIRAELTAAGDEVESRTFELAPLGEEVVRSLVTGVATKGVEGVHAAMAEADAIVVVTPVYAAGVSGLVKAFIDAVPTDLLIAKPVVLAATAGSIRHALVVDQSLRATFAYLRSLVAPTSIVAGPDDWSSTGLGDHIRRAALELVALVENETAAALAGRARSLYRQPSVIDDEVALDFDSALMRIARGEGSNAGVAVDGEQ